MGSIMDKSTKRAILRFLTLTVLLVLFFLNYLAPIVIQWRSKITNTAKHVEKVTDIEPPAITVCFKPSFKNSVFKKYNITEDIFHANAFPNFTADNTIKVTLEPILSHLVSCSPYIFKEIDKRIPNFQ